MARTILALLVSPVGALAIVSAVGLIPGMGTWSLDIYASSTVLGLGWGLVLLVAAPVVEFLRRRGEFSPRRCMWLGAVLGVLPFAVFQIWYLVAVFLEALTRYGENTYPGIRSTLVGVAGLVPRGAGQLLLGAACGTASAALFWCVGVWRNDRFAQGA